MNAQPGGIFYTVEVFFVYQYPKNIQTTAQLLQKWTNAGMKIDPSDNALDVLNNVGYYRLKGYSFHLLDKTTQQFYSGTTFADVFRLYQFDSQLSHLLFDFLSEIEVSLRARFVNALLLCKDALILDDPSVFSDKEKYWKNRSAIASEIARSNDVFILHNFDNHDGAVPLWAVVEVISFGTLSKTIKNLKTGTAVSSALIRDYKFKNQAGNLILPSWNMLTSWIQAASVMRNICAHNGRIYNRVINTAPQLIQSDTICPRPKYNGLYQILLAMKYLRPTDASWNALSAKLTALLVQYASVIDLNRINFPADWAAHFQL
jgi:abortive infection bacteriophage resistance protein